MEIAELKQKELLILQKDHLQALKEFLESAEAREERMSKSFGVHVTCMDERDRFAVDATGEPNGAVELFASPGGCFTQDRDAVNGAKKFMEIYGKDIEKAKKDGKEIVIYLMPHTCFADNCAGCAAFNSDEEAEYQHFSDLADELKKIPELADANIHTDMYDTDTHEVVPFHGHVHDEVHTKAADYLQSEKGIATNAEVDEWDRFHAGYRIYVGSRPLAWTPRRNVAYHLHDEMDAEELLEGIALAIKIIKTHSHANLEEHPMVIQIDHVFGKTSVIDLDDDALINRMNESKLLKDAGIEIAKDDVLIVRTETDPETWEGQVTSAE
ncbi:MAG: hypothetical protein P1P90_06135 [Patescibacteria group bacterium]|nr:hypothetical protein [Patescibacteria group bacterium]